MDCSIKKFIQKPRDSIEKILTSSKQKPTLIETDDRKKIVRKVINNLLELTNISRYNCCSSKWAVFAEKFIRTHRNDLEKLF